MSKRERSEPAEKAAPTSGKSVAKAAKTAQSKAAKALSQPNARTSSKSASRARRSASSGALVQPRPSARPTGTTPTGRLGTADAPYSSSPSQRSGVGLDGAVDAFRGLLEVIDKADQALLVSAVVDSADTEGADELDESLFGPAPTEAEVIAASIRATKLDFARRRKVTDSSLSREDAAALLDVSRETIRNYRESGDLLGLRDGKRWMFPLWQFDADAERGIVPGIAEVKKSFPGGIVSLTLWMTADNVNFDGRTPRDVLAAGNTGRVTDAAAALTAAGW